MADYSRVPGPGEQVAYKRRRLIRQGAVSSIKRTAGELGDLILAVTRAQGELAELLKSLSIRVTRLEKDCGRFTEASE